MNNGYENDFKVHDSYVSFSAEIARIAMLSPLILGFMLSFVAENSSLEDLKKAIEPSSGIFAISIILMVCTIFFALSHRYLAAEFMQVLVHQELEDKKRSSRLSSLGRLSQYAIFLAPTCLFCGYVFLFWGLIKLLIFGS